MAKQHSPAFLEIVSDAKSRIRECTPQDLRQRLDAGEELRVIDVREESEFAQGHIPGAIHLSKGVIERDIETIVPERDTVMVLYCGGGFRSALAADSVQKMGYEQVISMDGGWREWKNCGFATDK